MSIGDWSFDILLGILLLWLAWKTLYADHLFNSIVSFIAFGLVVALAWLRLLAPDLALAEAALGSGITGGLLLASLARLYPAQTRARIRFTKIRPRIALVLVVSTVSLSLIVSLGFALAHTTAPWFGLAHYVEQFMPLSGVQAEVTAVLLNFRGYDTLLEVAVLLVALLGTRRIIADEYLQEGQDSPVLAGLLVLLVPLGIVCAAYVLWRGGHAAGGAFQAGAVLAGIAVLLQVSGRADLLPQHDGVLIRMLLGLGLLVFAVIAAAVLGLGGSLLQYPLSYAGVLIVLIELACAISIGFILFCLFMGGAPDREEGR